MLSTNFVFRVIIAQLIFLSPLFALVGSVLFFYAPKIKWLEILIVLFVLANLVTVWAAYAEPNMIMVQNHRIETGFQSKFVLISDTHLGEWKKQDYLKRVVNKINEQPDIEAVLIAGDLAYHPKKEKIDKIFAPIKDIKYPTYAVLGNHDVEKPGEPIRKELNKAMDKHGVTMLQNQIVELDSFTLVGLGAFMADEDEVEILEGLEDKNTIALAHNPDTTLRYNQTIFADLTLTGHTHCGQVRIPYIYKPLIPTQGDFDKGLYNLEKGKLFITCGVGEIGMPLRLFNPPTIEVIETF